MTAIASSIIQDRRCSLFPIREEKIWEAYKRAFACFWGVEEVDLTQDVSDWDEKLNRSEKDTIIKILAFFAVSDTLVSDNLASRFLAEETFKNILEIGYFYTYQMMIENVHSEMYSLLVDVLIRDAKTKEDTFNAIATYPSVKKKAEWIESWTRREDIDISERIVAFIAIEGILFCGSFAVLFWLKKRGIMPGLSFSNQLISRDEVKTNRPRRYYLSFITLIYI
jgi:ribonucleoside-diphosphate reductase subunit M2